MKIDVMTKDKDTKTVVPALRFPEFRDGEGWIPNKIDHVCKIVNGRDYKHLSAGNIPVYGSGGYMTSVDKFLYDGESVCIGRKGTIDKPIFLTGKFWTVDTLFYTYAFYKCLPKFLYLIFQQINWHKYNEAGGVPSLLKTTIGNINIFIPNNESEQKKIVDCFSCLDDLISAVADKIETLKEYKKGLMQQLFPVEGKTIPAIRFPEFQHAGEWQTVSLGDVATFINGRAFKQDELLESGKYRVLRVGNFFSNAYWYHSDLELDENKYCDKGDLLYAWSASFGPRIWNEDKVIFHYHIWKVVEKEGISKDFLLILLDYETERIKNQQANGLGLLHITKGAIENWKTRVPKNILEQQKIAKNLSSVDELISIEIAKLDQLKAHKKGLMQQLFPKLQ